jgi:hypothetical protein
MRPQKETKPNKGFKKAFRAGIVVVIFLSIIISWISVTIINSVSRKINKKDKSATEDQSPEGWMDKQDTFYIEKTKEVIVRDTVYRYVQPAAPAKPKTEEPVAPKGDTLSK